MRDFLRKLWSLVWSGPVIAGSILVAAVLLLALVAYLYFLPPPDDYGTEPTASIYVIEGPTATLIPPTLTPAPPATATPEIVTDTKINIGSLVQIFGTDGEGLNLRSEPNTSAPIQFLGYDLELFEVVDGPVQAEGYWWWFLETPVEKTRSGWAVELYLDLIE
jgi:hypothetical protein